MLFKQALGSGRLKLSATDFPERPKHMIADVVSAGTLLNVFLIMENDFRIAEVKGSAKVIFYHLQAQAQLGASIFWTRSAIWGEENATITVWQLKRDGSRRGITEIV